MKYKDPIQQLLAEAAERDRLKNGGDDDDEREERRPELVAAMPLEAFDALVREVNPYVAEEEVRRMFEDARILQKHKIELAFREIWVRHELVEGRPVVKQPEEHPPTLSKLLRGVEPEVDTRAPVDQDKPRRPKSKGAGRRGSRAAREPRTSPKLRREVQEDGIRIATPQE